MARWSGSCLIKDCGLLPYDRCYAAMLATVDDLSASPLSLPQLWLVQHHPVYTAGLAASPAHFNTLVSPYDRIPFVFVDRGGQITYHGPGQLVLYLFVDVRSLFRSSPRLFVHFIEEILLSVLDGLGIEAHLKPGAPGVYVSGAKLVSLGFKFKRGWSYHGFAMNVSMDLLPFSSINPCGLGLPVTQIDDIKPGIAYQHIAHLLTTRLSHRLTVLAEGGPCGT